jgi:hypothetical protein
VTWPIKGQVYQPNQPSVNLGSVLGRRQGQAKPDGRYQGFSGGQRPRPFKPANAATCALDNALNLVRREAVGSIVQFELSDTGEQEPQLFGRLNHLGVLSHQMR